MGLLTKLQTQGSDLTALDGKTPTSYNGVSNYPQDLAKSQLDLDGLKPTIKGKYPYLDNLPK